MTRTVLVVEDDRTINDALAARLGAEGYTVRQAFDGLTGVALAAAERIDVAILDLMLPGLDGHEVCRRIQSARPVPVLMLTARDTETDVLVGLGVGADDYLTKPFRMREVTARVAALLRRVERAAELAAQPQTSAPEAAWSCGDLTVDPVSRRVRVGEVEVHVTPTEFDLLGCLGHEPGRVWSRERLLAEVWGWGEAQGTRTVDSHVRALRAKIGAERVRTVHGVGYALEER